MKKIIFVILVALAVTEVAFADSDGDHNVRPRPEYRGVQAEYLRTERAVIAPGIDAPSGAEATTVNFGFESRLVEIFSQEADAVDNWYTSDYTERP